MARVLDGMYIGGGWTTKSQTFPDYNPSDGSIWANIPDASVEDTRRAIEAAHEAFPEWAEMPFTKRSQIMIKAGEIFERRRQEIAEAVMASTISSLRRSKISPAFSMMWARFVKGSSDHSGNASCAASIALRASSADASGKFAQIEPSDGL